MDGNSLWVSECFSAGAQDCTPAQAESTAIVQFLPASRDPELLLRCASVLSGDERQQAERLITQDLKERFWLRRAFRRYCGARALGGTTPLVSVHFASTGKGRPCLPASPECWFSFSACRLGVLGAWSWSHDVGVDIEDPIGTDEAQELARHYFAPTEVDAIQAARGSDRADTFLRLWTLKEAALKSIGEGLPFGLDAFECALSPSPHMVRAPSSHGGTASFQVFQLENVQGCASLVLRIRG